MVVTEALPVMHTRQTRMKLFAALYENAFPQVAKFIRSRNGSFQDAKDIFQDSLVIFYEKIADRQMEIHVSEEAYIMGIAKHLWIRKFKNDSLNVPFTDLESLITIPGEFYPEVQSGKLLQFLQLTGKKCMELLRAFYYDKHSMTEISNEFGYSSEHSATVQKFKCLEKIRDKVKEKSMSYEDFTE